MDQDKISKFIKEIRKKNNLTQKELADKLGVTYQAVSKWENGKNLPDISLIKQMSKDFNISLDNIFDGEYSSKNNNKRRIFLLVLVLLIVVLIISIFRINGKNDFEFKTISTSCSNFNITGSVAYNENKSSIYISNIVYCGGNDNNKYVNIKCGLYEKNGNTETKINSYSYNKGKEITLEEFLKDITFSVNNYSRVCKVYTKNSLYLKIEAKEKNSDIITTYKIPLKLNDDCK